MKTKEEILKQQVVHDQGVLEYTRAEALSAMQEFADQEKQALKEKIINVCRQAVIDDTMSTSTVTKILDQFRNAETLK
jgi:hypothetical protein